jgi:predicted component of type VI protein secretion system
LQDLELRHRHHGVANAVARHLQQVLEQRNAPAEKRRDDPRLVVQLLEVGVPREGHEHIAE